MFGRVEAGVCQYLRLSSTKWTADSSLASHTAFWLFLFAGRFDLLLLLFHAVKAALSGENCGESVLRIVGLEGVFLCTVQRNGSSTVGMLVFSPVVSAITSSAIKAFYGVVILPSIGAAGCG